MDIAIVLYDRFTALDAVGPYEVLSRIPGAKVRFLADQPGPVRTDNGVLTVMVEHGLGELEHPDVILVPGGPGEVEVRAGGRVLEWLRDAHETSTWTTSVCTGSLILAAAGLLEGRHATSHWLALERLRELGALPSEERVVYDGKLVTAAGVSAGIDMGLSLAGRIAGDTVAQAIQLGIEYDPQPPYDSGAPAKAPADVVELLLSRSRHRAGEDPALAGSR
jgi:transcriptional regulator GlxA family with amidase domain